MNDLLLILGVPLLIYLSLRGIGQHLIKVGREQEQREALKKFAAEMLECYLCPKCLRMSLMGNFCQFCGSLKPSDACVCTLTRLQQYEHNKELTGA